MKQVGAGIGLPYEVRQEMALHLDDHQCALTVALHQYHKHHWMSEGAEGCLSLHELLDEHIRVTQRNIDPIGKRVARLGGVPTAHPVTITRAHELHDWGTAEVLQEVLKDREDLGYHLYSVLEDDTLVRGMGHLLDRHQDRAGDRPMNPGSKLQ